jgi:hypothetical protein
MTPILESVAAVAALRPRAGPSAAPAVARIATAPAIVATVLRDFEIRTSSFSKGGEGNAEALLHPLAAPGDPRGCLDRAESVILTG